MNDIKVVKVIDDYTVVINKGTDQGIKNDYKFLIYKIDPEPIIDPVSNKELGHLEIIVGKAKVKHLQENMCTITTYEKTSPYCTNRTRIINKGLVAALAPAETIEEDYEPSKTIPFKEPEIGDNVKIIANL